MVNPIAARAARLGIRVSRVLSRRIDATRTNSWVRVIARSIKPSSSDNIIRISFCFQSSPYSILNEGGFVPYHDCGRSYRFLKPDLEITHGHEIVIISWTRSLV